MEDIESLEQTRAEFIAYTTDKNLSQYPELMHSLGKCLGHIENILTDLKQT